MNQNTNWKQNGQALKWWMSGGVPPPDGPPLRTGRIDWKQKRDIQHNT